MAVILTGGPFIASFKVGDETRYVESLPTSENRLVWGLSDDRKKACLLNARWANLFVADMRKHGRLSMLETPDA